jgi:hypothetical protein
MSSGYGGGWDSAAAAEAAARREQQARIAMLREQTGLLRAQAEAARRIGVRAGVHLDAEAARNASSTELAAHAARLEVAVSAARTDLERRMREAWAARLGSDRPRRAASGPRRTAAQTYADGRREEAGRVARDRAEREEFAQQRRRVAADETRAVLAANLARCDAGDAEELERLASALGDDDTAGEQALRRKIADSIERREGAARVAVVRRELLTKAADALPAERADLLQMIRRPR